MSLIAAALFSLYIMLRYRNFKRTMEALKQLQPRLQAVVYYNLALSFLERLGTGKYPGETPREYSRRIIRDVYRWDLNFQEISEGINLALYSRRDESFSSLAEQAGGSYALFSAATWPGWAGGLLYSKSCSRANTFPTCGDSRLQTCPGKAP